MSNIRNNPFTISNPSEKEYERIKDLLSKSKIAWYSNKAKNIVLETGIYLTRYEVKVCRK